MEIKLGTYEYKIKDNYTEKESDFPGTNEWDELILKHKLTGKKLDLILRESKE
jgi:hypothetical protein